MEEKSSKGKSISIVMILLAIVIGFGFVIGLTQTSGANNLNSTNKEISNYVFDEEGRLMAYYGDKTEIEIPATYSLSGVVEEVEMSSNSIYTLIDRANALGIRNYKIENETGNITDDYGNVVYQEKYTLTYEKRKTIEGDDYQVTGIAANAFMNNTKITSVTLPETVTSIGSQAFAGCTQLKTINFPENLERIENSAFFNCRMLEEANLSDNINYIGSQAFQQCQRLTKVHIPNGITMIYDMTFANCIRIQEIEIPSNVRHIMYEAFTNCHQLHSVKFNEGLQRINNMAFYNCYNLTEIELPATLNQVMHQAFYRCTNLNRVIIKTPGILNISSLSFPYEVNEIFVPDERLADYPNYSYWYEYEHLLRPLSELEVA